MTLSSRMIIIRDLFLFVSLLGLIWVARQLNSPPDNRAALKSNHSFHVHEADDWFMQQIKNAKELLSPDIAFFTDIAFFNYIRKTLCDIEQAYLHTSAGLFLLGPLGTAAIILKEQRLTEQLLDILNSLGSVLAQSNKQPPTKCTSIEQALEYNRHLINLLCSG